MKIPFTIKQFLEVFKCYNQSIFPFQILLYAMALTAIYFAFRKSIYSGKVVSLLLTFLWFWMGIVYHVIYFSSINKAAYLFGALFVIQGIILFITGVLKGRLEYKYNLDLHGITGVVLIIFSLIIYPLLSYFNGHVYPSTPTFGLPCPTTIFTLGLLCWVDHKQSPIVWAIPILWSVIGFMAAISLGMKEDIGLFVAGVLFVIVIIKKNKNKSTVRY